MFNIEKICISVSESIAMELNLSQDKKEIINYGLFGIIQTAIAIIAVMIVSVIFNVISEALVISVVISLLRKSSGGVHASTPGKCALIGAVVSVFIAKLCEYVNLGVFEVIILSVVIFIWAFYVVNKLAPVDSASKPITKEKNRIRLKKISINIIITYTLITICNIVYYYFTRNIEFIKYTMCILMGTAWQIFTLTKLGHVMVEKIDKLF